MSKKTKASDDLQGLTRLVTDATVGVTELVEAMHHRVVHPPFIPSTPIQHLISKSSGIIYKTIKWSTKFVGNGLDKALGRLVPVLGEVKDTNEKKAIRSALNGVVGDYLEEKENPLKITMQFTHQGKPLPVDNKSLAEMPNINGKILLMVHGICMNDTQWTHKKHNHGEALAEELDKTLLYLYYNSGRHISTNGQNLNELLEDLILNWSVPVEELVIVGHSMGGLVSRSALHYGQQQQKTWTKYLKKIVFLGTPHHGAPLERAGNYIDNILELIPYAKPFARLGKIRSAGVTDLRYSSLIDEDWQGVDRFEMRKDSRQNIPLPEQIECYSMAASKGKETDFLSLGDGLVEVKSALGLHEDLAKQLHFKKENTWIFYENTHFSLLSNLEVYTKIKEWLI
jgi:pimeloyl-ACP methyl ester carboxylesterase